MYILLCLKPCASALLLTPAFLFISFAFAYVIKNGLLLQCPFPAIAPFLLLPLSYNCFTAFAIALFVFFNTLPFCLCLLCYA
jgi:hypothetical protein